MIPILYKPTETDFTHNGIGHLVDCISCTVTENRNGSYEAEFVYPITGQLYSEIFEDCIVKMKPNETSDLQLFRIYKSSKPFNGKVTFYCEHISYLLSGIPVSVWLYSKNAQGAMSSIFNYALISHDFTAYSDIVLENYVWMSCNRISIRNALGGTDGSILDTFGGEFEFDNFTVKLLKSRGKDTGIRIAYGKNLTDVTQEKSISETYTAVYPYATYADEDNEEVTVTLSEKIIYSDNASLYAHQRVYIKDFTEFFDDDETITEDTLRAKVTSWMSTSGFDEPSVNITVSFKSLWDSPEYESYKLLERVSLCDTVTVYYQDLGIEATAKVIKTVYDTLAEHYTSIELGDAAANLADNLNGISDEISSQIQSQAVDQTLKLNAAISKATAAITGQSGGNVVLNPSNNPQEILIMDTDDITTAQNVWRWNSGGLGFSSTGYDGEYATAITADGLIVADFIATGTLNAAEVEVINLSADSITSGTINGELLTIANIDTSKVTFSGDNWVTGTDVDETLSETLKDYSTTTEIETMLSVSEGNILLEVSETYATTTTLESYTTKSDLSETLLSYTTNTDLINTLLDYTSTEDLENILLSYSTTSQVESMLEVSSGNILLEVSEKYVTATTLENYPTDEDLSEVLSSYVETGEIRSRFVMDSSSITIESGVISFDSNSISINSDNFQLTTSGEVTATGTFTAGTSSGSQMKLTSGTLTGYYGGSYVGEMMIYPYKSYTINGTTKTYNAVELHSDDITFISTLLDFDADYINVKSGSSSRNYTIAQSGSVSVYTGISSYGFAQYVSDIETSTNAYGYVTEIYVDYGLIYYPATFSSVTLAFTKGLLTTII
ncbi:MAG: phage tail protein [Oscillospiraceae bacterium]|nr:phage tail protein [Oscillospiraceae bacterium]